ncbi:unnamed protein product [Pseudo-nitzschia multistriata]|uniref:Sulfotransferase domain-containing protein n=1 Tax=Pseudo-nitzschia multistriata TaxID=183589 RepID=A0A448ZP48_9STRA|nr:unnamed protein product [Pseudo-nitzschia multistriata]
MTCSPSLPETETPPIRCVEEKKSGEATDAACFGTEADRPPGTTTTTPTATGNPGRLARSTKHSPERGWVFDRTLPLLITATPRSGTVGTTRFLRELGLPLSDDAHPPTAFGMVSWIHCVHSPTDDYYGNVRLRGSGFETVLHQRRHVRKSITSLAFTTPLGTTPRRGRWSHSLYKSFVGAHVPLDTTRSVLYMGLQMWVEWQLFVREIADWHYRVEDLMSPDRSVSGPIVDRIFSAAGLGPPSDKAVERALKEADPRANTRKHRPTLSWEELYAVDERYASIAHALSKEYGYD